MTVPVLTFFNNKGGVGKTSLVYHLACMYAELEKPSSLQTWTPKPTSPRCSSMKTA